MTTRTWFEDLEAAQRAARTLDAAGLEVAVITERVEDADQGLRELYLLATPAPADAVRELLGPVELTVD